MTDNQAPEDLGAPVSYLVLREGTPAFDRSGTRAGEVAHVLSDERTGVFHGLVLRAGREHRFARAGLVDGLYEHGVIIAVPAAGLPEPSADPAARAAEHDDGLTHLLKKAWDRLARPR